MHLKKKKKIQYAGVVTIKEAFENEGDQND